MNLFGAKEEEVLQGIDTRLDLSKKPVRVKIIAQDSKLNDWNVGFRIGKNPDYQDEAPDADSTNFFISKRSGRLILTTSRFAYPNTSMHHLVLVQHYEEQPVEIIAKQIGDECVFTISGKKDGLLYTYTDQKEFKYARVITRSSASKYFSLNVTVKELKQ